MCPRFLKVEIHNAVTVLRLHRKLMCERTVGQTINTGEGRTVDFQHIGGARLPLKIHRKTPQAHTIALQGHGQGLWHTVYQLKQTQALLTHRFQRRSERKSQGLRNFQTVFETIYFQFGHHHRIILLLTVALAATLAFGAAVEEISIQRIPLQNHFLQGIPNRITEGQKEGITPYQGRVTQPKRNAVVLHAAFKNPGGSSTVIGHLHLKAPLQGPVEDKINLMPVVPLVIDQVLRSIVLLKHKQLQTIRQKSLLAHHSHRVGTYGIQALMKTDRGNHQIRQKSNTLTRLIVTKISIRIFQAINLITSRSQILNGKKSVGGSPCDPQGHPGTKKAVGRIGIYHNKRRSEEHTS